MKNRCLVDIKAIFIIGDENHLEVAGVPNGNWRALRNTVERDAVDGGPGVVNRKADPRGKGRLVKCKTGHVIHAQTQVKSTRPNRRNEQIETEFPIFSCRCAPVVLKVAKHHVKGTRWRRRFVFGKQDTA